MIEAYLPCSFCGYETMQKEVKNNGLEKEAVCKACQTRNFFALCASCGKFFLKEKKECDCKKGK